jgi:hypothetical protein
MQADRSQPGNLCTGETVRAAVVRNDGDAVLGWKFHHVETVACSQRRMSKADINRPFVNASLCSSVESSMSVGWISGWIPSTG